jgi:hypothetical protein
MQMKNDAPASAPIRSPAPAAASETAPVAARSLLVEDGAPASPEQMQKSAFLAALRPATCARADEELAAAGRDTNGCPYIENAFDRWSQRDASQLERAIKKFAPEAANARTARDYIPVVSSRVAAGVREWVETGAIPELPEGMSAADLMSGGAGVLGVLGSIGSAIGGLFSGIGAALFMAREGGGGSTSAEEVLPKLGSGTALEPAVRSRMESAFGYDFGRVRVHTGVEDQALTSSAGARALSVGEHIAFGSGEYRPGTIDGDAMIAHELAHTMQQRGAPSPGTATEALESDADTAAAGVMRNLWAGEEDSASRPRLRGGLRLSRCDNRTEVKTMDQTTEPLPAWNNRTEMEAPLKAAITSLWMSRYVVDHNTAKTLSSGVPRIYSTTECQGGSLPDDSTYFVTPNDNLAGEVEYDTNGQNPVILLAPKVLVPGFRTPLDIAAGTTKTPEEQQTLLRETLVHETAHAMNPHFKNLDSDRTFGHYKTEFVARWVSPSFRTIQPEERRVDDIKQDILNSYTNIGKRYRDDKEFRKRVDEYVEPGPDLNLTNLPPGTPPP